MNMDGNTFIALLQSRWIEAKAAPSARPALFRSLRAVGPLLREAG
jgi:hypothetical protein